MRGFTHHLIIQNLGVFAHQVPGNKKRCPVNIGHQGFQRVIIQHSDAQCIGNLRLVVTPVNLGLLLDRIRIGKQCTPRGSIGRAQAHRVIVALYLSHKGIAAVFANQLTGHAHSARGIRHIDGLVALVGGGNFHCSMGLRGGGAANHQGYIKALALHFFAQGNHLIQRGGNKSRQANNIDVFLFGGLQYFLGGHHNPQVNHLVVIALQHHADNIFANIVHITLNRSHQNLTIGAGRLVFFRFNIGLQIGHRLFHYPGRFHHLGQEHFARAKQVANNIHAVHQRTLNHMQGAFSLLAGFLGVLFNKGGDAFN